MKTVSVVEYWDGLREVAGRQDFVYWLFDGHPEKGVTKNGGPSAVLTCLRCLEKRDGGKYIYTLRPPDGTCETKNLKELVLRWQAQGRYPGGCVHMFNEMLGASEA